ncbi:DNA primase [Acidiphilium acidophilum]|uniref:DNA primase n=1 Tax=Acidiphilium acidophilum TaxID=76588 RepID=A0AAW9DPK6_ACIAO|nr:DNA primase [Acidiphilium acidophilum]MDX5930247.1 DNA primase [Acidiphilium acidophilum]
MSLPPNFLDELRARTPLAPLIARKVRLARSGRDQKGCCPFHNEKSPSFYVYDDHYHCFGCGAHGDAISFVMQNDGAGFMEAVERLAAEAGMQVPKPTPQAAEAERREADLSEVLAAAAAEYRRLLRLPQGASALAYLRGRGLSDATIEQFGLGWSGEGRGVITEALGRQGITPGRMIEAGLLKATERGPVDYFFARVMFPIRDRRGRIISFGGRVLGDGQPKYLNGPETDLFSKRQTLYGIDLARSAVRSGATLIVVEGYMDVIALHQAGFSGAVAPLGTALTEQHLAELWRISPRPLLCFDGDAAGRRAALRSTELAIRALAPDRGLAVLALPDRDDPDSLIRREGAQAFKARIETVPHLAQTLFDMLADGADRATPEGRAAFRKRLEAVARSIEDKSLAGEYRAAMIDRLYAERRQGFQKAGPGKSSRQKSPHVSLPRPAIDTETTVGRRARLLTAILLCYPSMLPDLEEAFGLLTLPDDCARLRDSMSEWFHGAEALDSADLLNHLTSSGLRDVADRVISLFPQHTPETDPAAMAELEASWYGIYGLMNLGWLREQCAEQSRRWQEEPEPEVWNRLVSLTRALKRAERGEADSDAVF